MLTKKSPKISQNFYCEKCDYTCSKQSEWCKHTNTSKHNNVDNDDTPCKYNKYCCICGKTYTHRQSLSLHKKSCVYNNTDNVHFENITYTDNGVIENNNAEDVKALTSLVLDVVKQNNELTKQIMELSKNNNITNNNNNTTNNNTVNNKFNLNVFLNDTCKDAMNLNDFVKSLQITSADFERFGKNGFVEGISNIMVKGLNKLELCKRPIHCSDLKRETIHLKEDNGWAKETDDGSKLKKVIKQIKHKNIDYTDAWKEENPEYKDFESKVHERYMKIINESMGGYNIEEDEVFYNKIIKNVAKETVIKKYEAF